MFTFIYHLYSEQKAIQSIVINYISDVSNTNTVIQNGINLKNFHLVCYFVMFSPKCILAFQNGDNIK